MNNPYLPILEGISPHPTATALRAIKAEVYEEGYKAGRNDRIAEEQALLIAKADLDIKRAKP